MKIELPVPMTYCTIVSDRRQRKMLHATSTEVFKALEKRLVEVDGEQMLNSDCLVYRWNRTTNEWIQVANLRLGTLVQDLPQ